MRYVCVCIDKRLALFNRPFVSRRVDSDWFLLRQQCMQCETHQRQQNPSITYHSNAATAILATSANAASSLSSSLYTQENDSKYSRTEFLKLKLRIKRLQPASAVARDTRATSRMQRIHDFCFYVSVGVWTVAALVGLGSMSYQMTRSAWKPVQIIAPYCAHDWRTHS